MDARGRLLAVLGLCIAMLGADVTAASAEEPYKLAGSQLEPARWSEVAGWMNDDHVAAFGVYQRSCRALRNAPQRGPIANALRDTCQRAAAVQPQDEQSAALIARPCSGLINPDLPNVVTQGC